MAERKVVLENSILHRALIANSIKILAIALLFLLFGPRISLHSIFDITGRSFEFNLGVPTATAGRRAIQEFRQPEADTVSLRRTASHPSYPSRGSHILAWKIFSIIVNNYLHHSKINYIFRQPNLDSIDDPLRYEPS